MTLRNWLNLLDWRNKKVKSNALRQKAYRQRQIDAGMVPMMIWTYPENRAKIRNYARRLNKQAEKQ